MNIGQLYTALKSEPSSYWESVLLSILRKPWVVVRGKPSVALQEKMAKEEAERVKRQIELLGQEGLEKKRERLERAMKENEIPVPETLLKQFKVKRGGTQFQTRRKRMIM